jgi:hypothetical protein
MPLGMPEPGVHRSHAPWYGAGYQAAPTGKHLPLGDLKAVVGGDEQVRRQRAAKWDGMDSLM